MADTRIADLDAERALLGSLILDPAALSQVNGLRAEHFAEERHRRIYAAIGSLVADGSPVEPLIIQRLLATRGAPVAIDYVVELATSAFTTTAVSWHADQISDCAQRRHLVDLAERLRRDAHDPGVPVANARSVARETLEPTQPIAPLRTFRAADARAAAARGISYLPFLGRDGLVLEGCSTMLAAGPKVGKSQTLSRVVVGWLQLGHRILWFTEESAYVWGLRLERLEDVYGPHVPWQEGIEFVNAGTTSPADLLRIAREHAAGIVIMDTVRDVLRIADESDPAAVGNALRPWCYSLAAEPRKTFMPVHHHRKGDGSHGDQVSGSTAFLATVDTLLELRRDKDRRDRRLLRGESRLMDVPTLALELDDEDRMVIVGEASEVAGRDLEQSCFEVLRVGGGWLSTAEVHAGLGAGAPVRSSVHRALVSLARRDLVLRNPPLAEAANGRRVTWSVSYQPSLEMGP